MSETSKLWTPPTGINQLRMRAKKRTVTLPDGTRALISVDDSGTVQHQETSDRLDAVVRPKSVTIQIRKGN
jgi:hypothetical protein